MLARPNPPGKSAQSRPDDSTLKGLRREVGSHKNPGIVKRGLCRTECQSVLRPCLVERIVNPFYTNARRKYLIRCDHVDGTALGPVATCLCRSESAAQTR